MSPIQHRYDFVFLFDVANGNPNGDPDADNMPRFDPETGIGLITDVCLKRKIRNFVSLVKASDPQYKIFVREKAVLNEFIEESYESVEVKASLAEWEAWKKDKKKNPKPQKHTEDIAARWMCDNYYDIRTFGAVMSTKNEAEKDDEPKSKIKKTAGQVRGPVQIAFAKSIDRVEATEHTITRCAATNEKDREKERTMGRKYTIPYGLYVAHGFISAHLAAQTGFSGDDLNLLWQAFGQMFEHDRSAARGEMAARGLYVFEHDSALGNAPAHSLFKRIALARNDDGKPARDFSDYTVTVNDRDLPAGVTLHRMIEDGSLAIAA